MEYFFVENLESTTTSKFCSALAEERYVGSPDAYEPTVGVQLEKEFVKGFNESDEGVKRVAASAAQFHLWESEVRFGKILVGARFGQGIGVVLPRRYGAL